MFRRLIQLVVLPFLAGFVLGELIGERHDLEVAAIDVSATVDTTRTRDSR
jgi:hypothetical protein